MEFITGCATLGLSMMFLASTSKLSVAEATYEGLTLDFNPDSMFTYAQTIIDALLPVVYITLGISLGFIVIRALKSAFS